MSPSRARASRPRPRFPRVSGDEPWGREKAKAEALFSPRERG